MTNPSSTYPVSLLADLDFVRRLARQLCGDEHTAEDVAQQTMVTALERPPKDGNRRGWLATVARNLAYRHHRSAKRRMAREQTVSRGMSVPSSEEVVAREQVRTEVVHAVLALPEGDRQIILLRFYRGVAVAECAEQLGITDSAVRSRAARAVQRLRARLDARHGGERSLWAALLLPLAAPIPNSVEVGATVAVRQSSRWTLMAALAVLAVGVAWLASSFGEDPAAPAAAHNITAAVGAGQQHQHQQQQQQDPTKPSAAPVRSAAMAMGQKRVRWQARGLLKADEGVLAGARVQSWLSLGGADVAEWVPLPEQKTDADGRYDIPLDELDRWSELARAHAKLIVLHSLVGYRSEQSMVRCEDVIRSPDETHVTARLYGGCNVHGRLLHSDGSPASHLEMRGVTAEGTYSIEVYADGSFQAYSPGGKVLVACGDGGHGQFLQVVDVVGDQLVDLGDVRLDDKGPFLEGTARYPDGTPLVDIPVSLQDEPWPESMTIEESGFTFANDVVLTRRPLVRGRLARTNSDGRYRVLHGGPGRYQLSFGNSSYFRKEFQLDAAGPRHLDLTFESRVANAHVRVIAQDEDGRILHDAHVKWFLWNGDKAPVARARYDQEGITEELLATARRRTNRMNNQSHEPLIAVRNELFALIEVSLGGAKAVCVPCELPAGRHEATVRVVLAPPGRTAELDLQVRTVDGESIVPLFVKVRRHAAPRESFLQLDAKPPQGGAVAAIKGDWHAVPANGRLELPLGAYDIELLAGARVDRGLVRGSNHPITRHAVQVVGGKVATLRAVVPVGARMKLSVSLPRGFDAKGMSMTRQNVTLTPVAGGQPIAMLFQPQPGDRINDGGLLLEAEQGVVAGAYRLTWKPRAHRFIRSTDPNAEKPLRMESQDWRGIDQVVQFELGSDPFSLQLVLQQD